MTMQRHRLSFPGRIFSIFFILIFSVGIIIPPHIAQAQILPTLPLPGTMVTQTPGYVPALIKGITIHPENPLAFDFIIDTGHSDIDIESGAFKVESLKLIKYFMAALTVPAEEMWVNLSPYEQDRIIPDSFGKTKMGVDLLAQDYILKQLTASMIYPEKELGKKFWSRVHQRVAKEFGTITVPMDNLHKVWIVPDNAFVYETENTAFVVRSHLKVMMEEDYFAMRNSQLQVTGNESRENQASSLVTRDSSLTQLQTEIMKEIVLPAIEKEVNEGKNFAQLRQIYRGMILATWFKQNLKDSLLGHVYVDQKKIQGINIDDPKIKNNIYQQYLKAFKQGVYNYIKEDHDPVTQRMIPQQYFSGGFETVALERPGVLISADHDTATPGQRDEAMIALQTEVGTIASVGANLAETKTEADQLAAQAAAQKQPDQAMTTIPNVKLKEIQDVLAELGKDPVLSKESLAAAITKATKRAESQIRVIRITDGINNPGADPVMVTPTKIIEDMPSEEVLALLQKSGSIFFTADLKDGKNISTAILAIPEGSAVDIAKIKILNAFDRFNEAYSRVEIAARLSQTHIKKYLATETRSLNQHLRILMSQVRTLRALDVTVPEKIAYIFTQDYLDSTPLPETTFTILEKARKTINQPPKEALVISFDLNRDSIAIQDLDGDAETVGITRNLNRVYGNLLKEYPNLIDGELIILAAAFAGWRVDDETTLFVDVSSPPSDQAMLTIKDLNTDGQGPPYQIQTIYQTTKITPRLKKLTNSIHPDIRKAAIRQIEKIKKQKKGLGEIVEVTKDRLGTIDQKLETTLGIATDDILNGGIDLNPELLDLKIKRDRNGVPLPIPHQSIKQMMKIEGFLPVIISVTPIQNLPMLLGLDIEPADTGNENALSQLDLFDKTAKLN